MFDLIVGVNEEKYRNPSRKETNAQNENMLQSIKPANQIQIKYVLSTLDI